MRRAPIVFPALLALMSLALILGGCAGDGGEIPLDETLEGSGPQVIELSTNNLVVGQQLLLYGHFFGPGEVGQARLRFQGIFEADDGSHEDVDLRIVPSYDGPIQGEDPDDPATEQVLRWNRFGPFANPFHTADRPGVFRGTITVETQIGDETTVKGPPKDFALEIGPSIVIEELQPFDADCGAPAARALAGLYYKLTVRAVGIRPVRFHFAISQVNGNPDISVFERTYEPDQPTSVESLGHEGEEPLVFNQIPPGEQHYVALIEVTASDAEGNQVETVLPLTVHRPLEVAISGKRELAERYEPVAVSGCIPGSTLSRVEYSETRTETRQQSVSVTVSQSFAQQHGATRSAAWQEGISTGQSSSRTAGSSQTESERLSEEQNITYGSSESNRVGYSSTDGETWDVNANEGRSNEEYAERMNSVFGEGHVSGTVGASGGVSVPLVASASGSVEATVGVRAGASTAGTSGSRVGTSSSEGWSAGGSSSDTRAFGSTTTDSRSESVSGAYALGSERTRSESDTTARSNTRTYNFGESQEESEVISEGMSEAEARTWTSSESVATTQGFSATIPNGQGGIFYRQTTRWVRRAEIRAFDLCGVASHLGELQFSEWTWAPELAITDSCSKPPASTLPEARCFIEPCGG